MADEPVVTLSFEAIDPTDDRVRDLAGLFSLPITVESNGNLKIEPATYPRSMIEDAFYVLALALGTGQESPANQRENDIIIGETVAQEIRSGVLSLTAEGAALEVTRRIRDSAHPQG